MIRFLQVWFNRIFRRRDWSEYITAVEIKRQADSWFTNFELNNPQAVEVLRLVVQIFLASKATNFFSVEVYDPVTMGSYLVTVQRKDKYAPAEIIEIYRKALQGILRDVDRDHTHPCYGTQLLWDIATQAENALQRVGFMEQENR